MITVGKGPFPSGILASRVKEKPPGLANSISVLNSADAVKGRIRNRVASFRFHREYFTCLLCQNAVREKMNRTSTVWKRGASFRMARFGILFAANKLGGHLYSYSALRTFFTLFYAPLLAGLTFLEPSLPFP